MKYKSGVISVVAMFAILVLLIAIASSFSNSPTSNNYLNNPESDYLNQQIKNPVIKIQTGTPHQNTSNQYQIQSVPTACVYMGGSWYQNTNTCAGNIDTNKCTLYGGKINGCDSSCRYAGSRTCYTTCETTCVFNTPYIEPNQQYYTNTRISVIDQISCSNRLHNGWWNDPLCTSNSMTEQGCIMAGGIYQPVSPCPVGYVCDAMIHLPTCTVSRGY